MTIDGEELPDPKARIGVLAEIRKAHRLFADGELDRSPTGTGVSGRAAIHHARDELAVGESMTIASVIGSTFDVRVAATTKVGSVAAIVPEVTGEAFITGHHRFVLDRNGSVGFPRALSKAAQVY